MWPRPNNYFNFIIYVNYHEMFEFIFVYGTQITFHDNALFTCFELVWFFFEYFLNNYNYLFNEF